jgi:hypothetical protein
VGPDVCLVGEQMRAAVRDVATYFPTAIVSGRCRDKVHFTSPFFFFFYIAFLCFLPPRIESHALPCFLISVLVFLGLRFCEAH